MATLLQPAGDRGEQVRDIARDSGRAGGGIEAGGCVPDRRQAVAHVLVPQVVEHDPIARTVGKLSVRLSRAGEVGIDLDAVADVRDEQERRSEVHTTELQSLIRISYDGF